MFKICFPATFNVQQFQNESLVTKEWVDGEKKKKPKQCLVHKGQKTGTKKDCHISEKLNLVCLCNILKTKTQL